MSGLTVFFYLDYGIALYIFHSKNEKNFLSLRKITTNNYESHTIRKI